MGAGIEPGPPVQVGERFGYRYHHAPFFAPSCRPHENGPDVLLQLYQIHEICQPPALEISLYYSQSIHVKHAYYSIEISRARGQVLKNSDPGDRFLIKLRNLKWQVRKVWILPRLNQKPYKL